MYKGWSREKPIYHNFVSFFKIFTQSFKTAVFGISINGRLELEKQEKHW